MIGFRDVPIMPFVPGEFDAINKFRLVQCNVNTLLNLRHPNLTLFVFPKAASTEASDPSGVP